MLRCRTFSFCHSLGVFHLFVRLETELEHKGFQFSEEEKLLGRCLGLLHDIGHGPLSHVLEGIMTPDKRHETWAIEIITAPTEIRCVLESMDSGGCPKRYVKYSKVILNGSW
ncbi:HD domain-containing protein [Thermanaeromonas sp. C210]|uniref:HD domain-containing protein n=1 Tax=Thermanaeromonas sp. C210 TaxID=2731925 RepID=UPI0035A648EC